jgi:hypothetical protein
MSVTVLDANNRVANVTVGQAFEGVVVLPSPEILSGDLPAGLTWDAGEITGTPTALAATSNLLILANGFTYNFTFVVYPAADVVVTVGLSDSNLRAFGTVGQPLNVACEFAPESSKFVTSYTLQAGTLQTGLSFSLAGKIAGIPRAAGVAALTIRVNQINASGTESHVDKSGQIIVAPAARDRYALRADLEMSTRKLTFPSAGDLPIFNRGEKVDLLLALYYQGVRRYLPATGLIATFKHFDVEEPVALNNPADVTVATEFLETTVEFPAEDVDGLLARGTDLSTTGVIGHLQLQVEDQIIRDLRSYDSTLSSVETVTAGEDHDDTFAFNLSSLWGVGGDWTTAPMTLDLIFTCPGDAALNMTFTRTFTLSKPSTDFVISGAAGTTTQTEEPTLEANWAATLALTGITGSSTSVTVATTLTTETQSLSRVLSIPVSEDWGIVSGNLNALQNFDWVFSEDGGPTIFTYSITSGTTKTPTQLDSDLTAGLGTPVSVLIFGGYCYLFDLAAEVYSVDAGVTGLTYTATSLTDPRSVTRADCTVSARLRGLVGDNTYLRRISSLPTPLRIVRNH